MGFSLHGQNKKILAVTIEDSLKLEQLWNKFLKGISKKDTNQLHPLSLPLINCELCADKPHEDYFVPVDTFLFLAFLRFPDSKLWQAMTTKKHRISGRTMTEHYPGSLNSSGSPLMIYELRVVTIEPNETGRRHEGLEHIFEFIKTNGEFKLFGFSSVP